MLEIVASYHCMEFLDIIMTQTLENGKKPSFRPTFDPFVQLQAAKFFFFKNLAPLVTGYHGQLSSCTISENNNDRILRKISDGQTDRQIDGQTDESDFMGCCLTNVERPIRIRFNHYNSKKY